MKDFIPADFFINMLVVFIMMVGLLIVNPNRQKTNEDQVSKSELHMPKIQLPSGTKDESQNIGGTDTYIVTLKKIPDGIEYFLNDIVINNADLSKTIREKQISSVKIRCDKEIQYGKYIQLLDILKEAGISNIYNIYVGQ